MLLLVVPVHNATSCAHTLYKTVLYGSQNSDYCRRRVFTARYESNPEICLINLSHLRIKYKVVQI
jgi:hypothetical protein